MEFTILVIDNYDSFTFNLVQQIAWVGAFQPSTIIVKRNDEITCDEVNQLAPHAVFISPGPGTPHDSGVSLELLASVSGQNVPIFGVCLGLQVLVASCGGSIEQAKEPLHGLTSPIFVVDQLNPLFESIPNTFIVTRYHSLIAANPLPKYLKVLALSEKQEIMALAHTKFPWWGVQFHPESFLSEYGDQLIHNFLKQVVL